MCGVQNQMFKEKEGVVSHTRSFHKVEVEILEVHAGLGRSTRLDLTCFLFGCDIGREGINLACRCRPTCSHSTHSLFVSGPIDSTKQDSREKIAKACCRLKRKYEIWLDYEDSFHEVGFFEEAGNDSNKGTKCSQPPRPTNAGCLKDDKEGGG